MDEPTLQLLLTDSLLLDAVDGVESIAGRLIELYDRWNAAAGHADDVALLAQVLADLGWWSGRFQGAVSLGDCRRDRSADVRWSLTPVPFVGIVESCREPSSRTSRRSCATSCPPLVAILLRTSTEPLLLCVLQPRRIRTRASR